MGEPGKGEPYAKGGPASKGGWQTKGGKFGGKGFNNGFKGNGKGEKGLNQALNIDGDDGSWNSWGSRLWESMLSSGSLAYGGGIRL